MATSTTNYHSRSTATGSTTSPTNNTHAGPALAFPDLDLSSFADPEEVKRIHQLVSEAFDTARKEHWKKLEAQTSVDPVGAAQEYAKSVAESKVFYELELKRLLDSERKLKDLKGNFDDIPEHIRAEQEFLMRQIERQRRTSTQSNQHNVPKKLSNPMSVTMGAAMNSSSASKGHSFFKPQPARMDLSSSTNSVSSTSSGHSRAAPHEVRLDEDEESGSTTSGSSTSASESEDYGFELHDNTVNATSFISPGSTPPTPQSIRVGVQPSPIKVVPRHSPPRRTPSPSPPRSSSPTASFLNKTPQTYSYSASQSSYSNAHQNRQTTPPPPKPPSPPVPPPMPTRYNSPLPKLKVKTNQFTAWIPKTSPISPTTYASYEADKMGKKEQPVYNPSPNDIYNGNWSTADFEDIQDRSSRFGMSGRTPSPRRTSFGNVQTGQQQGRRPSLFGDSPGLSGRPPLERRTSLSSTTTTPTSATFARRPSPPNTSSGSGVANGASQNGNGTSSTSQQIHASASKPSLSHQFWNNVPSVRFLLMLVHRTHLM